MLRISTDPPPIGPGKYDGRLAAALDALDGEDEATGSVDDSGHARLMLVGSALLAAVADSEEEFWLDPDEVVILVRAAGAILLTDSDGFVTCTVYRSGDLLRSHWDQAVRRLAGED